MKSAHKVTKQEPMSLVKGIEWGERLQALLTQHRGGSCQVAVQFHSQGARGTYSFGADWNVRPTPALIEALETLLGRGRIAVLYSPPPMSADRAGAG